MLSLTNAFVSSFAYHAPKKVNYAIDGFSTTQIMLPELSHVAIYYHPSPKVAQKSSFKTIEKDPDSVKQIPVILYSHGNSDDIAAEKKYCGFLAKKTGYHVFTYDYVGYGCSSPGQTSETNMMYAIEGLYEFLKKNGFDQIILYGKSLGTICTNYFASVNRDIVCTVLVSPLASGIRCFQFSRYLPHFLLERCDKIFGNSISVVGQIRCRVLIFHGNQDKIIHKSNSEALAEELRENHRNPEVIYLGTVDRPGTCLLYT